MLLKSTGVVSYGKIKRGNRELIVEAKTGERKIYLVKLSNQILVQENDFVRAGSPLSDGSITPEDILRIKGPTAVQEYLVNEIQEVYRLQGKNRRQALRNYRKTDDDESIYRRWR